jgi:hypothetical protein
MVESQPSKLLVAGSIPVSRSTIRPENRHSGHNPPAYLRFAAPMLR